MLPALMDRLCKESAMLFHPEVMDLAAMADKIRKVPDWPKEGILFHDITPVLQSPEYFRLLVDLLVYRYMGQEIDVVAGLDARGFIIGAALAYQLNVGFVPIRKKGKLPFDTVSQNYALEYGEATVEIHTDAIQKGARVLLVDDLVATGGTMLAGVELIRKLGGDVVEAAAILEFTDLPGGRNLRGKGVPLFTLFQNDGTMPSEI
jgi:adenine phosphoribosyltransferase